jgi:hypothetical protein
MGKAEIAKTQFICGKTILCVLLIATALVGQLSAQNLQSFASSYKGLDEPKAGELNFRFESLGFFQNNEYVSDLVDGYTLTGALLRPKLSYSPVDDLYIEVGAHLVKYNGKDNLVNALPWFSARYRFSERFAVVTGNLDQTNQHGLPEQLWEPERIYTDKPEAGLQFIFSGAKLNSQIWVNWEQFIQKNDPYQERFTAGATANYVAFNRSWATLKIPVEVLFYHQGGEINVNPEGTRPRVQTHVNFGAGLDLSIKLGQKIKSLDINWHRLGYAAQTWDSSTYPFKDGWARLLEARLQTKHSTISLSHWKAFQFIAPKGRELYQSVSYNNTSLTAPDRVFLSAKYFWQKNIAKGARVAFQFETYFLDAPIGGLSYSYGFFLLLNPEFLLKKF